MSGATEENKTPRITGSLAVAVKRHGGWLSPMGSPQGDAAAFPHTVNLTEDPVSHALLWLGFWWLSMVTVFHTGHGLAAMCIFEKSRCKLHPTCVVY